MAKAKLSIGCDSYICLNRAGIARVWFSEPDGACLALALSSCLVLGGPCADSWSVQLLGGSCADSWSVQLLDDPVASHAGESCADSQSVQLLELPCADSQSVQLLGSLGALCG